MFAAHNALIPAVYIMLVRPGQAGAEILLQLRQGTGFMDDHWACGVAGHLEYGEQPTQGALRECLEEIGLQLEPQNLQPFQAVHRMHSDQPIDQRADFFFLCRHWQGQPRLAEPDKAAALAWFPLADLPSPLVPHEGAVIARLAAFINDDVAPAPFTVHPAS